MVTSDRFVFLRTSDARVAHESAHVRTICARVAHEYLHSAHELRTCAQILRTSCARAHGSAHE